LTTLGVMTIVRWVFVLAIVGFILAGVALFDIAERLLARSAGTLDVYQAHRERPV
jgi:hypothetical protein